MRARICLAMCTIIAGLAPERGLAQASAPASAARTVLPPRDGSHDFDFEIGTWKTHFRRLAHPLAGSTEWLEYDGTTTVRKVWDGRANLVELVADGPAGHFEGLSLRLYDPTARQWSLNFSNSRTGTLSTPTVGEFRNGRGEFYDQESFNGRMVLVRFVISDATPGSCFVVSTPTPNVCRFEQAFSDDGGRTWEVNWIATDTRVGHADAGARAASGDATCCPVVELRRYSLHPGGREKLITLFDREFVDAQEAAGIRVIAQFRDIDHPDFFTWMRGFPEMESRATSLGAFYFGPVWARYKNEANATMISSDNVRLLQPTHPRAGIAMSADRPPPGATAIPPGLVVVTIYTLTSAGADGFADWFERTVAPRLTASGARPIAAFETNPSANTFPRLPVREGEHAFVWVAHLADVKAYDAYVAALAADSMWRTGVRSALEQRFAAPVEVWRLVPTARSRTVR